MERFLLLLRILSVKQVQFLLVFLFFTTNLWAAPSAGSSYDWRIYENASGDPATAYAAQNSAGTVLTNSDIIRIRVVLEGSGGTLTNLQVKYSTNDSTFTALGSGNAWNWATSLGGTDGGTIAGLLISDGTTKGIYCKSASDSPTLIGSDYTEYDFEIQPTATVTASTLYYFRVYESSGALSPSV